MKALRDKVTERYYWAGVVDSCEWFARTCVVCQQAKTTQFMKPHVELHPIKVHPRFWKQIGVDMMTMEKTPDGYRYVLSFICYFSKWVELWALKTKNGDEVAEKCFQLICRYGCPSIHITDRGREFINHFSKRLHELTAVNHRITSAYHPQANGLVERQNRSTINSIRACLLKDENGQTVLRNDKWPDILECTAFSFRSRKQASTKYSPYEIVYGNKMRLPVELKDNPDPYIREDETTDAPDIDDKEVEEWEQAVTEEGMHDLMMRMYSIKNELFAEVSENIEKSQMKQKVNYDKRNRGASLPVGTKVWRRCMTHVARKGGKMAKQWDGPYHISAITAKHTYELTHCVTGKVYGHKVPAVQLKLYCGIEAEDLPVEDADTFYGNTVPVDDSVVSEELRIPDTPEGPPKLPCLPSSLTIPETQLPSPHAAGTTTERVLKKWKESPHRMSLASYLRQNHSELLQFHELLETQEKYSHVSMPPILSIMDNGQLEEAVQELEDEGDEYNVAAWKYLRFGVSNAAEVNELADLAIAAGLRGLVYGVLDQPPLPLDLDTPVKEATSTPEEPLIPHNQTTPLLPVKKAIATANLDSVVTASLSKLSLKRKRSTTPAMDVDPTSQPQEKKRKKASTTSTVADPVVTAAMLNLKNGAAMSNLKSYDLPMSTPCLPIPKPKAVAPQKAPGPVNKPRRLKKEQKAMKPPCSKDGPMTKIDATLGPSPAPAVSSVATGRRNSKRTLGVSRMTQPIIPKCSPSPSASMGSNFFTWNKSARNVCTRTGKMIVLAKQAAASKAAKITTESLLPPKKIIIDEDSLAFHLNEVQPNCPPPSYQDVTQEREILDPDIVKELNISGVVEARPMLFKPLSWAMRKAAADMLSLPHNTQPGDFPWVNVEKPFPGPPDLTKDTGKDGNCYFRAVSWVVTGTEHHHERVRKIVCRYIEDQNNFIKLRPHLAPHHRVRKMKDPDLPSGMLYITPGEQYVKANKMALLGTYATQVEIFATAFILGKDIFTWVGIEGRGKRQNMQPRWQAHCASGDPLKPTKNALYLVNLNEHFQVALGPNSAK